MVGYVTKATPLLTDRPQAIYPPTHPPIICPFTQASWDQHCQVWGARAQGNRGPFADFMCNSDFNFFYFFLK